LYMYRLVRYMYISFDVYDCGKCTNTAALEMWPNRLGGYLVWASSGFGCFDVSVLRSLTVKVSDPVLREHEGPRHIIRTRGPAVQRASRPPLQWTLLSCCLAATSPAGADEPAGDPRLRGCAGAVASPQHAEPPNRRRHHTDGLPSAAESSDCLCASRRPAVGALQPLAGAWLVRTGCFKESQAVGIQALTTRRRSSTGRSRWLPGPRLLDAARRLRFARRFTGRQSRFGAVATRAS